MSRTKKQIAFDLNRTNRGKILSSVFYFEKF